MEELERPNRTSPSWQPLAFAVVLILGIIVGRQFTGVQDVGMGFGIGSKSALSAVLDRVERLYVDPVIRAELEQIALEAVLEELDPHSMFISSEELAELAEPMEGNFEGIGVEFIIQDDTLMVVASIPGGPAERAGIRAGDRIVTVDSLEISGPELTNRRVMELLKGPRGTRVMVGLQRKGGLNKVVLERDRIPIHSVVCSANLDGKRGYIKVIRFAQNTAVDFDQAMRSLSQQGLNEVIIDLRGNGGGYLNAVVPMVESFLEEDMLVVYTEGEHAARRVYSTKRNGDWKDWDLVVLVDESSASASEIFAGAIQDHDRGPVIGRRTFGKGLVQEEFSIDDIGALRLTVARFYTPTGRAIQRPYGEGIDYSSDYFDRYESGELFHQDSIALEDSLLYKTPKGKWVHGGGGITPDVFLPLDTARLSGYLSELSWSGVLRDAAFSFVDEHRDNVPSEDQLKLKAERWKQESLEFLLQYAKQEGLPQEADMTQLEEDELANRMFAQIIRNINGESSYYEYLASEDPAVQEAQRWLKNKRNTAVVDGRLTLLPSDN